MAAKNIGTKHINQLFNLPDSVTVSGIIRHEHCDEYIVTYPLPEQRVCPHCHSCDCVIKDSGADQTIRHTVSHDRGTLVTFHKVRLLCHSCHHTFYGLHEFDTFRKRVLLCFGAVQLDKSPYTIFREKRDGGKMIF